MALTVFKCFQICGNKFKPTRVDQRFCQDSCRRQYTRLAYRAGGRVLELLEEFRGGV